MDDIDYKQVGFWSLFITNGVVYTVAFAFPYMMWIMIAGFWMSLGLILLRKYK